MKPKYLSRIIIFVLPIIIALVGIGYIGYLKSNTLEDEFKERLFSIVSQKETFTIDEVTNFEWNKLYIFEPYTFKHVAEEEMGVKWDNSSSDNAESILDNDSMHKLVFVNDKEIVFKIDLERYNIDFLPIKKIINDDKTKLVVHKEKNNGYHITKASNY